MICFFLFVCFHFIYFFDYAIIFFPVYMVVARYFELFFFLSVLLHYVIVIINADFAYELFWRKLSICIIPITTFDNCSLCVVEKIKVFAQFVVCIYNRCLRVEGVRIWFCSFLYRVSVKRYKTELGTQINNERNLLNLL